MRLSHLQVKILIALRQRPVTNLAELGREIGAKRSSVSRSMSSLEERGLVVNQEGWRVTDAGKEITKMLDKRTIQAMEDAAQTASRAVAEFETIYTAKALFEVNTDMKAAIDSLIAPTIQASKLFDSLSLTQPALTGFHDIVGSLRAIDEIVSENLASELAATAGLNESVSKLMAPLLVEPPTIEFLKHSLPNLLDTQALGAELLRSISADEMTSSVRSILAEHNSLIASSIVHIEALQRAILSQAIPSEVFHGFATGLGGITGTYQQLMSDELAGLVSLPADVLTIRGWESVTLPTIAVQEYSAAVGTLVEEPQDRRPFTHRQERLGKLEIELETHLDTLRYEFKLMRRGSWEALEGDNPDRLRHAASSAREVIRQVLQELFPDIELDEDELGSKMKRRVRAALRSETAGALAFKVADAVHAYYSFLSKPAHTWYGNPAALEAALVAGDAMLLFIFAHREDNQD